MDIVNNAIVLFYAGPFILLGLCVYTTYCRGRPVFPNKGFAILAAWGILSISLTKDDAGWIDIFRAICRAVSVSFIFSWLFYLLTDALGLDA